MNNPETRKPSLELRINSVNDAKAVVFNMSKINQTREMLGLDSVEFIIASEVKVEVAAIIYGVFRCKTYVKYMSPQPGNTLFSLPHFQEKLLVLNGLPEPREEVKITPKGRGRRSLSQKQAARNPNVDSTSST